MMPHVRMGSGVITVSKPRKGGLSVEIQVQPNSKKSGSSYLSVDKHLLIPELASGHASRVSQIGVHLSRLRRLRDESGFWPHGLLWHHDTAVIRFKAIVIVEGGIIRAFSAARHAYETALCYNFRTQHLSLRRETPGVRESQIEKI